MTPTDMMLEKCAASGIDAATADALHFTVLEPEEILTQAPGMPHDKGPALKIPYYNMEGNDTGFYRFRYLKPPASFGRPVRYVQPHGTVSQTYFPTIPGVRWDTIVAEPVTLHITEGELKAACATLLGFPCIGLGGVWNWRAAKKSVDFLPDLEQIQWRGRAVYVTFDSDLSTNPQVLQAQHALCDALLSRGARPHVVSLPRLDDNAKTGLDDFLLDPLGGPGRYAQLMEEAEEWASSRALHKMNEEVMVVDSLSSILERSTGRQMSVRSFHDVRYAHRQHTQTLVGADGSTRLKAVKTSKAWIEWPHRASVRDITYKPGVSGLMRDGRWSTWRGWGVDEDLIRPGNVKPWKDLIERLMGSNLEARAWFEAWCAYPFKYPGTKLYQACVLWGVKQGTGKTLIGETLKACYGTNGVILSEALLHERHNGWMDGLQFVLGEEIAGGDKRAVADALKNRITQAEILVNQKYLAQYTIPDCINYLFTSNHPDAFFLEDNDRRYFVWEVHTVPLGKAYADAYGTWKRDPRNIGALIYHFRHDVPVETFDPRGKALTTNAKREMIMDSRSELGAWVWGLTQDPWHVLTRDGHTLKHHLWSSGDLANLYNEQAQAQGRGGRPVSASAVSRELKKAGFTLVYNGHPIVTRAGAKRLWAIGLDVSTTSSMTGRALADLYINERLSNDNYRLFMEEALGEPEDMDGIPLPEPEDSEEGIAEEVLGAEEESGTPVCGPTL